MEKELEKTFNEICITLFKTVGKLIKSLFLGLKKLNKKNNIICFLCMFIITASAVFLKHKIFVIDAPIYIRFLIYYMLLFSPGIYLIMIGSTQDRLQEKYKKIFNEVGFLGQNKQVPFFIGKRVAGKKEILVFQSNIPLQEWRKAKDRLENGLDCNIVIFSEGKNKKIVELTTVPSSCRIPDNIDWSDELIDPDDGVIVVGQDALGTIKFDLNRVPHVLMAGETGSGKSVLERCCLNQMVKKDCQVYMFDFKGGVEFGKQYEQFGEVITDRERAVEVLTNLSEENARRLTLFRELEVKNLKQYNKKTGENLQRIGVFIDEIGEMMDKKGASSKVKPVIEQLEGIISSLARLSRATGINLFLGVQRPDANVLTGQIKNNIPVRISGRFADKSASEIVLGNTMATELPDTKGRFLCKIGNEFTEFQAYFFDDEKMLEPNAVQEDSIQNEMQGMGSLVKKKTKSKNNLNPQIRSGVVKKNDSAQELKVKISETEKKSAVKSKNDSASLQTDDTNEIDDEGVIDWEPLLKKNNLELDLDYSQKEKQS